MNYQRERRAEVNSEYTPDRIDRLWAKVEGHVPSFIWRPVLAERMKADLHAVRTEWTLDTLVAAHRLLDALDETERLSKPPPRTR